MGDSVNDDTASTNIAEDDRTSNTLQTNVNDIENDIFMTQNEGVPIDIGTPLLDSQQHTATIGSGLNDTETTERTKLFQELAASQELTVKLQQELAASQELATKLPIPTTPTAVKTRQTARPTPLVKRTRAGRAKPELQVPVGVKKDDLLILRAENRVLKNAVKNLELTVNEQNKELTTFRADLQFLKLEMKKASEVNAANEKRFSILQSEQEKSCDAKIKQHSAHTQKTIDKISTKADQAFKRTEAYSFSSAAANNIKGPAHDNEVEVAVGNIQKKVEELEVTVRDVQTDVERLEHVQAGFEEKTSSNVTNNDIPAPASNPTDTNKPAYPPSPLNFTSGNLPVDKHGKKDPATPNDEEKDPSSKVTERPPLAKTLVIMDSNQKHLKKLWENTEMIFSPNARQLLPRLPQLMTQHKPDLVLIHNGTNDLDHRDGATVAETLQQIVLQLKNNVPKLKIVISEITPRKVNKDDQVQICNKLLHTYFDQMDDVTIATHSSLRTDDWKFCDDDKHLAQKSIGKFARNLKTGLRAALGIQLSNKDKKAEKKKGKTIRNNKSALEELAKQLLQVMQEGK